MTVILIILGLGAGVMILASLAGEKMSGGISGGESKGRSTGKTGKVIGGKAVGGGVKNFATAMTKTSMGTKDGFFRSMANLCKGYDWDQFLPMAMAALETNWTKSCYFNNLFNITTSSTDPNQFFMYKTIVDLKFKMYYGFQESVAHFWNLLKFTRYTEAYKNRNNPEQAIRELIKAGYAGSLKDPSRYLAVLTYIRTYYRTHFA